MAIRHITAAGGKQVQANWNESDPNSPAYIQNKPDISGALTRQVVTELPTEDIDPNCIYMIAKSDPETGDYYDEYMYISDEWELIGSTQMTQVQSDWTQSDPTAPDYIKYKPPLPQTETINQNATPVLDIEDSVVIRCTVPLTSLTINRVAGGQYESNLYFTTGNSGFTMTVPNTLDGIVGSTVLEPNTDYIVCFKDNRMVISYSGYTGQVSVVNNAPTLAYGQSADIGSVNGTNLSVTMPAAPTFTQVNSDWNASSGVAQILNKPTIPTVNDATITIQQNGTAVGSFTTNDNTNKSININASSDWFGTQQEFDALQSYDANTNYHIEEELATVAFTGDYDDLTNKPTIPTVPSNLVTGVNVSGVDTALTLRIITQSDYDALVQGGTVDANTVYMIN